MDSILTIAISGTDSQVSAATIYAYASQFFSGTLDPTWPHGVLIFVSVAAGVAVGVGIVLEAEKFFSLPTMLVVFGVAFESVCTILLFGFDEGISKGQKAQIDSQQLELIAATNREGCIENALGNRYFDPKLLNVLGSELAKHPSHTILLLGNFSDPEIRSYAGQLIGGLYEGKWYLKVDSVTFFPTFSPSGIYIPYAASDPTDTRVVQEAFRVAHIPISTLPVPPIYSRVNVSSTVPSDGPEPTATILVGGKDPAEFLIAVCNAHNPPPRK
jgi:hypothetical protein